MVTSLDYTGVYERVRDRALHRAPPETAYCTLSLSRNLKANLALWSLARAARCHPASQGPARCERQRDAKPPRVFITSAAILCRFCPRG